jgi:hypothetical protein
MAKIKAINFKNPAKSDLVVEAFSSMYGYLKVEDGVELPEDEFLEKCVRKFVNDVVKAHKRNLKDQQDRQEIESEEVF